jgi:group I intron endonuclease
MLKKGMHHSRILQRAWDKHGADSFVFQILETVADRSDLLSREQHHIDRLNAAHPRLGYNVCPVAGTREGVSQPASVAVTMSAFHIGKPKSDETRAKMSASMKGKVKSEEHKQKLREAAQRQFADPEARKKAAEYGALASGFKGCAHSDKTKINLRQKAKQRMSTPEGRTNQMTATEAARLANTGKPGYWAGKKMSDETRTKMSAAHTGKKRAQSENFKHSDEWRTNHAAKIKQAWADRKAQGVKYR